MTDAEREQRRQLRIALYERCGGRCEMKLSPKCLGRIYFEGGFFNSMHMAHKERRWKFPDGGWNLDNLLAGCIECHMGWEHNGGKPCPPKVRL